MDELRVLFRRYAKLANNIRIYFKQSNINGGKTDGRTAFDLFQHLWKNSPSRPF
jgi:hypothetical protein